MLIIGDVVEINEPAHQIVLQPNFMLQIASKAQSLLLMSEQVLYEEVPFNRDAATELLSIAFSFSTAASSTRTTGVPMREIKTSTLCDDSRSAMALDFGSGSANVCSR